MTNYKVSIKQKIHGSTESLTPVYVEAADEAAAMEEAKRYYYEVCGWPKGEITGIDVLDLDLAARYA